MPLRAGRMRPSTDLVPSGNTCTQSPLLRHPSAACIPCCCSPAPLSTGSTCKEHHAEVNLTTQKGGALQGQPHAD